MHHINSTLFNPEVLYVVDFWNEKENLRGTHHHDFLELSIVLEGVVEYQFHDEKVRLGAGQALIFNPGIAHNEHHPENNQSHELHIGLSNLYIEGLKPNAFPIDTPLLDLGPFHGIFLDKAWELTKEYNLQHHNYQLMGKGIIIEMLTLILRSLDRQNTTQLSLPLPERKENKHTLVNQAIYFLENHHAEAISLEDLAKKVYLSPNQLSLIFRELTGTSPINYLIEIRLRRAKDLLLQSDLSVKEVSEKVGYEDPSHFSKSFKKKFGVAPSLIK